MGGSAAGPHMHPGAIVYSPPPHPPPSLLPHAAENVPVRHPTPITSRSHQGLVELAYEPGGSVAAGHVVFSAQQSIQRSGQRLFLQQHKHSSSNAANACHHNDTLQPRLLSWPQGAASNWISCKGARLGDSPPHRSSRSSFEGGRVHFILINPHQTMGTKGLNTRVGAECADQEEAQEWMTKRRLTSCGVYVKQ